VQEKVLTFVLREHPNSEYIPKAALIQWLQQEYEVRRVRGWGARCGRLFAKRWGSVAAPAREGAEMPRRPLPQPSLPLPPPQRADHPDAVVPPGAPGLMPFMLSAASAASSGDEGPDAERVAGSGGKLQRASSGPGSGRLRAACGGGGGDADLPGSAAFLQQAPQPFGPPAGGEQQAAAAFQQQAAAAAAAAAAYQQHAQFMQQPYHQAAFPGPAAPGSAMDAHGPFPPHFG
jgi:hypothetical protein